jgi:hypothetical protein
MGRMTHEKGPPGPLQASPPSPLDRVRDEVQKRFGEEAIARAGLLRRRERRNPSDKPPRCAGSPAART